MEGNGERQWLSVQSDPFSSLYNTVRIVQENVRLERMVG